jgi:phosphoglycerol transferase MdoB-like AlkP superfamily enzyme
MGTVYSLYRFYPGKNKIYEKIKVSVKSMAFQTAAFAVIFSVLTVGARGGLQLRPINMLTAVQYLKPDKVALVTNSTFTMINSYTSDRFEAYNFYTNEELSRIFTPEQMYIPPTPSVTKKNVVILILESFGAEYSSLLSGNKTGYMPFLDSLMSQSYYFTRAYANGKKSMEALPAIISGIPALMENPYITSPFSSNIIMSIPIVLEKFDYETYFFHGGANGTMGFDNFSKAAGIDNYMGINEYVGRKADFDGHWGIFDEPYLQYVANVLDTVKKPFFAGVFTLSSHHPYKVPDEHAGKFPKGEFPILESVAYADYALQRFFERASKSNWYKNTLFILTADHTAQSYTPKFSNVHGNYRVPLVFFDPTNRKLSGVENHVVQHTDIFPSVVHYLNIKEPVVSFGTSVFERDTGWAVSYLNNVYQLVTDSLLIQFDEENLIGVYHVVNDPLLRKNLVESHKKTDLPELIFLKAIIQDFRYRMINNRLTAKWPVKGTK